jgi:hypothetical protein
VRYAAGHGGSLDRQRGARQTVLTAARTGHRNGPGARTR